MKKIFFLVLILSPLFVYAQSPEQKEEIIKFYPLKIVDTIYTQKQIDEIKEKQYFYIDENTINENLFFCMIKRTKKYDREREDFYETLVKKEQNIWILYDYDGYRFTEKGLTDNRFYIITVLSGNGGHNGNSGGGTWSWAETIICFLDFEKMTISEEITNSYIYNDNYYYVESEEDVGEYHSIECDLTYTLQDLTLTISESYCKDETYRSIDGTETEQIEEKDTGCPCLSDGIYHYINGVFVKEK